MQTEYIINRSENSRLVIFFTGWSTNKNLAGLFKLPDGYDLIICWDYRKPIWRKLEKIYEEVLVFAWSFGVPIVEELYDSLAEELNLTGIYAINGSRLPVDDEMGIPDSIFKETLKNLDEKNLQKFKIRIAGGVKNYKSMESYLVTELSLQELKEELMVFSDFKKKENNRILWDCAFISDNDKIFPSLNLQQSWRDTPIHRLKEEHLPDFVNIFNSTIKDKAKIRKNFSRSFHSYDNSAIVQKLISQKLIEELKKFNDTYSDILELGSGSGYLSNLLIKTFNPKGLLLMDMSPTCPVKNACYICGDIETLINSIAPESFDLVVSGSTMQWFHSPTRIFSTIFSILKDEGIVGLTTFLPETYHELTELTGDSLLYFTEKDWILLAQRAGFDILESAVENHVLKFNSVKEVFEHIKATGVNSLAVPKSIKEMKRIISSYPMKEGKYQLTYQALTLILKKKNH